MPRVVDCTLNIKTNTAPVAINGIVLDRIITGREIWVDLRLLMTEEDMVGLSATPGSGFLQAFQEKIKSAFESAAVRDALAGEVRRGRLIGGEV